MYTVPDSNGGNRLPSSSTTITSEIGHGLPTVPGLVIHSAAPTYVPPPSVAA